MGTRVLFRRSWGWVGCSRADARSVTYFWIRCREKPGRRPPAGNFAPHALSAAWNLELPAPPPGNPEPGGGPPAGGVPEPGAGRACRRPSAGRSAAGGKRYAVLPQACGERCTARARAGVRGGGGRACLVRAAAARR